MIYDKSVNCIHEREVILLGDTFILCKLKDPCCIRCEERILKKLNRSCKYKEEKERLSKNENNV